MQYDFDPELIPGIGGLPSQDLSNLPATRAQRRADAAARTVDSTGITLGEHSLESVGDRIDVRVYTPEMPAPRPAVLLLHGGGWVLGSLVELHARAVTLCRELGAVVVAPEYRLAPEHR